MQIDAPEKTGLTELVFILNSGGSMVGLEKDTIGGSCRMILAVVR